MKDQEIFDKITEILPEKLFRDSIDELSANYFSHPFLIARQELINFSENILSKFSDHELGELFSTFLKSFKELNQFLMINTGSSKNGFYDLYPELKNTKPDFWNKKSRELLGLANRFENDYKKFLVEGSGILSNKEKVKDDMTKLDSDIKPRIFINFEVGIYKAGHREKVYDIGGKRLETIKYLCSKKARLDDLATLNKQSESLVSKEIGEINDNFIKILEIEKSLIINSKTSGYRLNRDELDITILD